MVIFIGSGKIELLIFLYYTSDYSRTISHMAEFAYVGKTTPAPACFGAQCP